MIARAEVLRSWAPTPSTHAIRIARPRGFDFAPVQFVGLEIATQEGSEEYPMSLASTPTRPHLEFGVRVSASPFKQAFRALKPGDEVEIDGPYGHFILDETRPAVLVAGGIGITPLKGMAEYATDTGLDHPMALVYSNRSPEEVVFREELEALAAKNPRFRLLLTVTRPGAEGWEGRTGRIDAAMLREAAQGMADPAYYACGTPEFVSDMVRGLRGLRVAPERIVHERFTGY